ncbi:hypothetical protein DER45DRAFT_614249 [Fusarium avenaceum]|nr:hypothetical protein DER45DRAFT_614249 [Fusarium avenaceum]
MAYRTAPSDESTGVANCVIRYVLATAADSMSIAQENYSNSEILRILHKLISAYRAITDIKFLQPKENNENSGKSPCLLLTVKDWESENEIRKNAAQIGSALGLSTSCFPLRQRFMAHVRDVTLHQHLGNRRDLRTVVSELNLPPDVSASVIFGRLLLTIYDLPTALELCWKPMRILGVSYDVV